MSYYARSNIVMFHGEEVYGAEVIVRTSSVVGAKLVAKMLNQRLQAVKLLKETAGLIPTTGWDMQMALAKKVNAFLVEELTQ